MQDSKAFKKDKVEGYIFAVIDLGAYDTGLIFEASRAVHA